MAQTLRIDFVSDVACPWCVIGLRALERALEEVGSAVEARIHLQPFELNPQMGSDGENIAEHIQKKYGASPERSATSRDAIRQGGEALGFQFNYGPESRIWNTFDAHRLLHWAALEGRQLQLKHALFKANFTDQAPTSDRVVLVSAAQSAGLDPARAREILDSDTYAEEARAEEALWRDRGINAVPTIIFNERWMIQGAQAPDVLANAIRDIVARPAA
jgi:predicted DsbA family dithiol-disulfide isomerase